MRFLSTSFLLQNSRDCKRDDLNETGNPMHFNKNMCKQKYKDAIPFEVGQRQRHFPYR
jgi:hypothetical protein